MYLYNSYQLRAESDYNYDYYIHGPHHARILKKKALEAQVPIKSRIFAEGDPRPINLMTDILNFFKDPTD